MVYGIIDRKSRKYYTYLGDVFNSIGNIQLQYNWLITDTEIYAHSEKLDALNTTARWQYENGKPVAVSAPDYYFLTGEELTDIVKQDDSQWIWGVLSGFERSISLEEILKYPLPESDGASFWKNPPAIQHPLASLEIVPWDSDRILLFTLDKDIAERFRASFKKSQDLAAYNALHSD